MSMKKDNFRFYWEEPYEQKEAQPTEPSIRIEMPGFSKDEITAKLANNMITVSASKKSHEVKKGRNFYREQASSSSFSKSVALPHEINARDFEVVIKDGIVMLKKKKKITERF